MKHKLDNMLNQIQLYSYLLPTVKIGNAIMDFREKYTLSGLQERDKVEEMKNKEKYAKEILEIACSGGSIAIIKKSGHIVSCNNIECNICLFHDSDCGKEIRKWAESEYIEKPVISKRDRAFLEYLKGKYEYIARDKTGKLYVYGAKPVKHDSFWTRSCGKYFGFDNCCINIDFPMVKWEDSEPWLIEDLKKLEVVEEYE